MADHVNHLSVYGTPMGGQANHARFCADALIIEPAVTTGRLHHLPAGFPAMLDADDGQVFGEAMTFADLRATLGAIDRLEGYQPASPESSLYIRVVRPVASAQSAVVVPAFCYVWRRALPQGAIRVPCGRWGTRRQR